MKVTVVSRSGREVIEGGIELRDSASSSCYSSMLASVSDPLKVAHQLFVLMLNWIVDGSALCFFFCSVLTVRREDIFLFGGVIAGHCEGFAGGDSCSKLVLKIIE